MNSIYPFYTIGHATRGIDEFIRLLKGQNVTLLADIRSVPRSKSNPEYNIDALPGALALSKIEYVHIPELGGFRAKSKTVPLEVNAYWQHNSFHSYADYAMGETFREGLEKLLDMGKERTLAFMCAETVWWKCHRRIVTDYLLAKGEKVFHIISEDKVNPARLTSGAQILSSGVISYPLESLE